MVEDRLQDLDSATCGIFKIYFYQNLFNPDQNRKIQRETRLNKKTVETLLNEFFSLDDKENGRICKSSRCKNKYLIKKIVTYYCNSFLTKEYIFLIKTIKCLKEIPSNPILFRI